jgi:hypothetical protein
MGGVTVISDGRVRGSRRDHRRYVRGGVSHAFDGPVSKVKKKKTTPSPSCYKSINRLPHTMCLHLSQRHYL